MKELATASGPGLIGCTQMTEILYTPGVQLVGVLPKEFELTTVYTAAIASRAEQPQAARLLIDMLAAPEAAPLRRAGGFE
jgi:molybdate transport system substrate-binding protein